MDPGKLRKRGSILKLVSDGDSLAWTAWKQVYLTVKETGKKNLFSRVGIGTDGAEIILREQPLTLNDAILWENQHYFLTDIVKEGIHPVYLKLQSARITPKTVTVKRNEVKKGKNNTPLREEKTVGSFPGCVTEKYLGSSAEESHIEREIRFVVVAPKAALYQAGDIFEIEGNRYRVMVVHLLEPYKNEYEIQRTEDD